MEKAIRTLSPFLTEARKSRIASVVASRTNTIAVLLENIADEGNENAVVRSMEGMGFQNLHRVYKAEDTKKKAYLKKRTDSGARNWITIHDWMDTTTCIKHLKRECAYRVAVASPNAKLQISELDFTKRLVVAFGNETRGVSEELSEMADVTFSLPMCGFVQSFNISVSVAITLSHAYTQRALRLVR